MNKSWKLVNADLVAKESKYTFYKPSKKAIDKLLVDNFCKLIFEFESDNPEHPSAERMWVIIEEINDGRYRGRLDNAPLYIKDLALNDSVEFEAAHIIDLDVEDDVPSIVDKYVDRCLATQRIIYENATIGYLYREEPMEKDFDGFVDSGWRFMVGDETQEYVDDRDNLQFVSLGLILNSDDSFLELLESPVGSEYYRDDVTGLFVSNK